MGSPIHATPADRLATRKLASAVLEAIREDEAMPIGMRAFFHGGGLDQAYDKDDVEALIAQLCGEIVAFVAERDRAMHIVEADCDNIPPLDGDLDACAACGVQHFVARVGIDREAWNVAMHNLGEQKMRADALAAKLAEVEKERDEARDQTCARHADQKHGADLEARDEKLAAMTKERDDLKDALTVTQTSCDRRGQALAQAHLDLNAANTAKNSAESAHSTALASLAAVTAECNEYHEMLRSILAECGATTREHLGPDAPLRAVKRLKADRDSYARSDFERQLDEARADNERLRGEVERMAKDVAYWRQLAAERYQAIEELHAELGEPSQPLATTKGPSHESDRAPDTVIDWLFDSAGADEKLGEVTLVRPKTLRRMIVEIRERRAADSYAVVADANGLPHRVFLSGAEVEALAHVRRVYPNATGMHHDEANRAMSALDKLIGGGK